MNKRVTTVILFLVATWAVGPGARANNTSQANAEFLMLNQIYKEVLPNVLVDPTPQRWFDIHLVAGRSYAFIAWTPNHDASEGSGRAIPIGTIYNSSGNPVQSNGQIVGSPNEPTADTLKHRGDVDTIIPSVTSTYSWRLVGGSPYNFEVHILAIETTLFSPWYFVDVSSGYDGFVEIRNNTRENLDVTVTAYDSSGSPVGTKAITLPANGNDVVQIGTEFAIAGGFGSVQIAHYGMPGAVSANITTLSPTTGLSFDAPFNPRMVWGTSQR